MVVPLDSPQPVFALPPIDDIPDNDEDVPQPGSPVNQIGVMRLPEVLFGAGTFSNQYNDDGHLASYTPLRTIRLALRYGICAFDTSAYYGPSEIVLGTALKTLELEFPRSSYKLMTKCGRYGMSPSDFDYSPSTIRASVQRSLARLHTNYLDSVCLHDIEFVCTTVAPRVEGCHESALTTEQAGYGLIDGEEGKVWGLGDQTILDAVAELRKMQSEGLIKSIGITGYQLPTLLRIALLVLHTAPFKPLDVLLSYSHLTLQNSTFAAFAPHFQTRAKIAQLLTASPLSMGLLTPSPPPWHPAPEGLRGAAQTAHVQCTDAGWNDGLPSLAVGYGFRKASELGVPMVVGFSKPKEVHESIRVWRELKKGHDENREACEGIIAKSFGQFQGFSWASP